MGGSVARSLARLAEDVRVSGWSPDGEEREAALAAGAVHRAASTLEQTVGDADLVVLAAPLGACIDLLPRVADMASEALLTDVASLKAPLATAAEGVGLEGRWVGCHPMAGSERSGFGASTADLYRDALVWIVSHPEAEAAVPGVEALWHRLGADTQRTSADAHDRLMVAASHLPQLTANALAAVMEASGIEVDDLGPGGREATRLAASDPGIWRDILSHAPPELADSLREVGVRILDLARRLEAEDLDRLEDLMHATRAWREGSVKPREDS